MEDNHHKENSKIYLLAAAIVLIGVGFIIWKSYTEKTPAPPPMTEAEFKAELVQRMTPTGPDSVSQDAREDLIKRMSGGSN